MVARDDLHGLLDELVALVFELFAVAILAGVHTATEVVVLRRRRWRSVLGLAWSYERSNAYWNSPIAVSRDHVVDPQLLADLLNPQMRNIGVQLLGSHRRSDGSWEIHQPSRFVVCRIAPPVSLPSLLGAVGIELRLAALRAASALRIDRRRGCRTAIWAVITAEAATRAQWDGVSTGLPEIVSPRHLCAAEDENISSRAQLSKELGSEVEAVTKFTSAGICRVHVLSSVNVKNRRNGMRHVTDAPRLIHSRFWS